MDILSLVNAVCCQLVVSATSRSLFQRSPTECVCLCVSQCAKAINNLLHLQCVGRSQIKIERKEIKGEITKEFKTQGRVDECMSLRSF